MTGLAVYRVEFVGDDAGIIITVTVILQMSLQPGAEAPPAVALLGKKTAPPPTCRRAGAAPGVSHH